MDEKYIYIEEQNNPLVSSLNNMLNGKAGLKITEEIDQADIIISLAYHSEDDIIEMETMSRLIESAAYKGKKVIFLSWFHPVNDLDMYYNLFNPEKHSCKLMHPKYYRILQLPVLEKELYESIQAF